MIAALLIAMALGWLAAALGLALALTAHRRIDRLTDDLHVQRQSDLLALAERIEPGGPPLTELAENIGARPG